MEPSPPADTLLLCRDFAQAPSANESLRQTDCRARERPASSSRRAGCHPGFAFAALLLIPLTLSTFLGIGPVSTTASAEPSSSALVHLMATPRTVTTLAAPTSTSPCNSDSETSDHAFVCSAYEDLLDTTPGPLTPEDWHFGARSLLTV